MEITHTVGLHMHPKAHFFLYGVLGRKQESLWKMSICSITLLDKHTPTSLLPLCQCTTWHRVPALSFQLILCYKSVLACPLTAWSTKHVLREGAAWLCWVLLHHCGTCTPTQRFVPTPVHSGKSLCDLGWPGRHPTMVWGHRGTLQGSYSSTPYQSTQWTVALSRRGQWG